MNAQQRESRTFLRAHAFLLCVVLVGFARSFYLRGLFLESPLHLRLAIHGVALTLWFVLTVLQAWFAASGRRSLHVRTAWATVLVVPAVLITGAWVNTALAWQIQSAQDPENMFIWANYMSLLSFAALVGMAVVKRRRLPEHRRLVLFASIAIIGPAFARFAFWPVIGAGLALAPAFAGAGMLLLTLAAAVYDWATLRRVHATTLAGFAAILLPLLAGTALAVSGLGFGLIH